jgi:hypothetical protein
MVEHWIENPRIVVQFHFWAYFIGNLFIFIYFNIKINEYLLFIKK